MTLSQDLSINVLRATVTTNNTLFKILKTRRGKSEANTNGIVGKKLL